MQNGREWIEKGPMHIAAANATAWPGTVSTYPAPLFLTRQSGAYNEIDCIAPSGKCNGGESVAQQWASRASTYMGLLATAHGIGLHTPPTAFSTLNSIAFDTFPMLAFMRNTELVPHSRPLDLDDIVLRGARYLIDFNCDLAFELILIADKRCDAMWPPHLVMRVFSEGEGISFMADPTIRLHERIGDYPSPQFETLFEHADSHLLAGYPDVQAVAIARFADGTGVFDAFPFAVMSTPQVLSLPAPVPMSPLPSFLSHTGSNSVGSAARGAQIAVALALTEIARIAQTSLAMPHLTFEMVNHNSHRNGRLGNRIAMLMAVDPNAGTIPFANYMQLVCGLCTERVISPKDALTCLTFDARASTRTRRWPSAAISSHWCNAAAPIFAQALAKIVDRDLITSDWLRINIIQLLSRRSIDENATGAFQKNLNFYEKLQMTDMNATAIRAADILCAARLMPQNYASAYHRDRMATEIPPGHHPFPLKTLRQLSIIDEGEMNLAIEFDATPVPRRRRR